MDKLARVLLSIFIGFAYGLCISLGIENPEQVPWANVYVFVCCIGFGVSVSYMMWGKNVFESQG